MLRAALLPRSQPAALNCLLISKRWQKVPGSPSTTSSTTTTAKPLSAAAASNPTSTTKTSTTPNATRPSTTAYPTSKIVPSSARTGTPPGYSSRPPTKKSGGAIKAVIYGVAFGLTATLVYAEYENGSFRRQLETTIPYASDVFGGLDQFIDPIFGRQKGLANTVSGNFPELAYVKKDEQPVQKLGDQVKATTDTVKEKLPDKTQLQKATEKTKETVQHALEKLPDKKTVTDAITHASDQVKDSAKSVKTSVEHAKVKVEEKAHQMKETIKEALPHAKGESGAPASKIGDQVFREEAGETALPPPIPEEKYKKLEDEVRQLLSPLTKQIDDAVQAAHEHINHMKELIESPHLPSLDHETWKRAENLQEQAKAAYEKVGETFRQWKEKLIEYTTASNGQIHPDEKKLDEKYQELQKHYTTSTFVKNFRTYIDEATRSFQKEIETMFPSVAGKHPTQLTQEDLQALLVHAHRRIVKLQNDIARMRVNENDSVKAAIDAAKADLDRVVEDRVQHRVQQTTAQLSEELKTYEKTLRQQFDEQLKFELVLQHQALTQYLADVLSRQYQEWAHEYEKRLETESIHIQLNVQNQLRGTLDRLHAMEQAIEANYQSQVRGRQAQQLWIQAQNLLNQVVQGTATEQDLDALAKIVPDEKFVQILLNELKTDDLSSTNEEILRQRFTRVKTLCRRFALIDEEHNSLWNYFLSYLQSLLIVRQRDDSILVDDAIDFNQLNTFTILNYVQSYLDHNQWYNALRLMQLLTGEPRNVAQSWISDARSYLAKKQTSELLEAYSNSIGLGTLPRST